MLWQSPLYVLLKFRQNIQHNAESLKWNDDVRYFNISFFRLLWDRPQYKTLLIRRIGIGGGILRLLYGSYPIYISPKMDLGGGVYMDHPHGTHLNAERIGRNLKIKHNVTIGNNHGKVPIIGDNVFLGCGACVLGGITIGDNVKIGANSVVTKSVPANSVVVGNPAHIVKSDGERVDILL